MAKTEKTPPTPVSVELRRFDEANVARLGLISIQERIPSDYTSWVIEREIDGRTRRLECVAPAEFGGVPHGLDGDIANAIIDLFIEQGAPASGEVSTTAYKLLRRAGLSDDGRHYQRLNQSLFRLRGATYTMRDSWYEADKKRFGTTAFSYLESFETISDDEEQLLGGSALRIRVAKALVRSVRANYLKPLDLDFLRALRRPLARNLYRLLDARRLDPEDLSRRADVYAVGLLEWALECKIVDKTPDKIRRTLEGAHEELLERGYLAQVVYAGRGQKQTLTYVFAPESPVEVPPDPEDRDEAAPEGDGTVPTGPASPAVLALGRFEVSRVVAAKLVAEYGEDRVLERVAKFEAILASGFRPRRLSAALVDVVRDEHGKYPDPPNFETAERRARRAREAAERRERAERARATVAAPEAPSEEERAATLPLEERVALAMQTLRFLLQKHVDAAALDRLRARLLLGHADPQEVSRQVYRAKFENRLDVLPPELVALLEP